MLGTREDAAHSAVIEQLEATLRDPAWHVRETAVHALEMMHANASIPALKAVLDDEDAQVRLAATQVIEHIESVARTGQQENVIGETTSVPQLSRASTTLWPQWMRRPVAPQIHRTNLDGERELPVLEEKQDVVDQHLPATSIAAETPRKHVSTRPTRPRRPWLRVLEQAMAALLVLGIAISWFAISHLPRSSSGAPTIFNDTNAHPLGAPAYTIQGNLSDLTQWSNDGHTFFSLQVNTQRQALQVNALNATTGHSTTYPVLDSSWLTALRLFNIEMVGHYLFALRAHGNNFATLEIWDITGQRSITTQTVPASIAGTGQVVSPFLVYSDNQQKFAMLSPDGTITIWNIASGQKLLTLDGKASYVRGVPPEIKWYNHDQSLLFFGRNNFFSALQAWDTTTGSMLINQHNTSASSFFEAGVSPDGRYVALAFTAISLNLKGSSSSTATITILQILDAHSGQVLHTYKLQPPGQTGVSFYWLSDSQHLLLLYMPDHTSQLHIQTMDALTGKITSNFFSTYTGFQWLTPDSKYLLLGSSDSSNSDSSRSMQIWQTSNGHLVATIATPGLHPNPYSYFGANNQYMLIGEKDTFDIWNVATGKLLYKYHGFTPFSAAGAGGSNVFWSPDGKYLTMIAWKTISPGAGVITIWRMP